MLGILTQQRIGAVLALPVRLTIRIPLSVVIPCSRMTKSRELISRDMGQNLLQGIQVAFQKSRTLLPPSKSTSLFIALKLSNFPFISATR